MCVCANSAAPIMSPSTHFSWGGRDIRRRMGLCTMIVGVLLFVLPCASAANKSQFADFWPLGSHRRLFSGCWIGSTDAEPRFECSADLPNWQRDWAQSGPQSWRCRVQTGPVVSRRKCGRLRPQKNKGGGLCFVSWWVCLVLHFASFMSYCKSLQTRPFALRWLRTSTCPFFTEHCVFCRFLSNGNDYTDPILCINSFVSPTPWFFWPVRSERECGQHRAADLETVFGCLWYNIIVKSKGSDDVCYLYCSSSDRESLVLRHCWVICEFRIVGTHVSATTCTWGIQMERTTRLEGHHFTPKVCNRSTDSRLQILTWVYLAPPQSN